MNSKLNCTLGMFAKWPKPGQVKTRLAQETSPEWAARIALAMVRDTLDRLAGISCRRVLACAPKEAIGGFSDVAAGRFQLQPQAEGDLGQSMAAFFAEQLRSGANRVVLVGADSPTLPISFVEQAFAALANADVVLGPAIDGGYYLVGCSSQNTLSIFEGISWGTSIVMSETVARVRTASLKLSLLPVWYDVDTADDVCMLRGHIAAMRAADQDPKMPFTEALLCEDGRN